MRARTDPWDPPRRNLRLLAWVIAVLLAVLAWSLGGPAMWPLRLAAGLVFGIQDALTRQTLEILQGHPVGVLFTNWPPYCLLGAGIVGLWLMQNAFSAAPLHCSLPAIAAGEPVAGIVLGIVVFGDVPDRWTTAGTVLVILAGVYVLRHRAG